MTAKQISEVVDRISKKSIAKFETLSKSKSPTNTNMQAKKIKKSERQQAVFDICVKERKQYLYEHILTVLDLK